MHTKQYTNLILRQTVLVIDIDAPNVPFTDDLMSLQKGLWNILVFIEIPNWLGPSVRSGCIAFDDTSTWTILIGNVVLWHRYIQYMISDRLALHRQEWKKNYFEATTKGGIQDYAQLQKATTNVEIRSKKRTFSTTLINNTTLMVQS